MEQQQALDKAAQLVHAAQFAKEEAQRLLAAEPDIGALPGAGGPSSAAAGHSHGPVLNEPDACDLLANAILAGSPGVRDNLARMRVILQRAEQEPSAQEDHRRRTRDAAEQARRDEDDRAFEAR